jgi:DNA-directed RNA polymerase subunit RPC12/RpoP
MALRIGPWGKRPAAPEPPPPPPQPSEGSAEGETERLACEQCGAVLAYRPGTSLVVCEFCGHQNPIVDREVELVEHDLQAALQRGLAEAPLEETRVVKCSSCAAEFTFEGARHAGACPFCGHAIVAGTGTNRHIKPEGLLPFAIDEPDARERVRIWLKGLWFAPGKLKDFARRDRLAGMYLPYWTFDSHTRTRYRGQRGTIYYVPVQVRTVVNGKTVVRTQMVQKVRWQPAAGRVARDFDDVLVPACLSLPTDFADGLEPWDLHDLRPYTPEYLTGFQATAYQVPLDEGFGIAGQKMRTVIAQDVKADIGGDLQRVERMEVSHLDPSFKHILLPVWLGAFRFGDKSYHLCVNGRTGRVQGERPWSAWKLTFLALVVAAALALFLAVFGGDLAALID